MDDKGGENTLMLPLLTPFTLVLSLLIPSSIYITNTTHEVKQETIKQVTYKRSNTYVRTMIIFNGNHIKIIKLNQVLFVIKYHVIKYCV